MSQQTARIGMLSFDHMHAYSYTTCLQQIPDVEVAGIWHEEAVKGKELAGHFGVPLSASVDQLLEMGLDGVIICSANVYHRRHVDLAAGRTRAILCEKPLATNLDDAHAIIDRCRATHTRLQTAFPVRFYPAFQRLKQMLDHEELGRILAVECTNHGSMPGGWFVQPQLSGGGAVLDHTVHVIDLLRWFWDTDVTEVYAEIGKGLFTPALEIDDAGLLSFTLATGAYGTLDTSWSRPASYPTWGDVKIEVIGEKGVAYADLSKQHVSVSANRVGKTQWAPWGGSMDMGLMMDFVEMIRLNREPSISGEDGLAALEVALAAYRSAELGAPVTL